MKGEVGVDAEGVVHESIDESAHISDQEIRQLIFGMGKRDRENAVWRVDSEVMKLLAGLVDEANAGMVQVTA